MSLTRLVMRLAAARALRDRTLAGPRVFDSAVDPIDQTIAENRQPLLVLTTDEHALDVTGRDLGSGAHRCDLVIEIAIASRVELPASDGDGGQISIAIPHTDEGMELTLDIMEHQVTRALTRNDNAWSRVWMKLVPRVTRRLSRRGASSENGVRFAARQLVLTSDLVDTPVSGDTIAPNSAWGEALALMEADPILANIANLLRTELDGSALTDWRRAAEALGLPLEVANHIGIGPIADLDADPQPLSDVTFADFDLAQPGS
ncbi:MAG: hypothetical protein CML03_14015 [Pseudooceanicola sp.]|nr:hypothetical protein [Pseudooceanicola sp.]